MLAVPATWRGVAIVGRANVGKSSLFNRLVGRRLAIVHAERGVTRDRLVAEARWAGRRFELVDTGGLGWPAGAPEADIERAVRRQAETAIRDADTVLLVTDAAAGLLPLDEEIAGWLRRSGRRVLVAANKCDQAARETAALEFSRLGFPLFPISVLHGRGLEPLLEAIIAGLPVTAPPPAVQPLRIVLAGRPNVGKSSLVNRLACSERVIVAPQPGVTRDSVEVPLVLNGRHYLLTDTAGWRPARRLTAAADRLSVARTGTSIARADVVGLVLDAVQGPTAQDRALAASVIAARRHCVLILNKWDLAGRPPEARWRAALQAALPFCGFMPAVPVSALTGFNLQRLLAALDAAGRLLHTALPTAVLNRVLQDACRQQQPPLVRGRRLKIFYAAQTAARPLTLLLFVNDPGLMPPAFRAYLLRRLRAAFDLAGAAVVLQLRARRTTD